MKHHLKTAAFALLSPFVLALVLQVPLCVVPFISNFFSRLPPYTAMQLLSLVFIFPSYIILYKRLIPRKQRMIGMGAFTAFLIVLLPLLWIFGFYTSRLLFSTCITA